MKLIILFTAIILTGLSAGLFYAWSVSVIPGTKKIGDLVYLQTMQSINREILNPLFFLIFFGSLFTLVISSIQQYGNGTIFWMILFAAITYLVGTFGVTAFGNVPLNNELDAISIGDLSKTDITKWRSYFEPAWNRLHTIRTVFALLSFYLVLHAAFLLMKSNI
jgi:uncharacterized membrane protein